MDRTRAEIIVSVPRPLTSLIGREQEINHLCDLLKSDVPLVTVTGFGGVGKTRLALQAALELEPVFAGGAFFISLSTVTQGQEIPRMIAAFAGLDESVDTPAALAKALDNTTRLMVLDNLEQIPDAASMVLQLLQAMPNVIILATSRSRLDLGGEYVVPLEPLETEASDPRSLPAVQLFIERAKLATPSVPADQDEIDIIGEICRRLEGIPLAIELAAARLAIFTLPGLLGQLDTMLPVLASQRTDLPARQRTMRDAIAWTFDLLSSSEQRLFAWLSVYEQHISLDSLAHVARQLELTETPIDLVQKLVSRSLLRPSRYETATPHYQMLQILREFGQEVLRTTAEDHLARRMHAMDMVSLAEREEPLLITGEARMATQRLNDERANIFAAMSWGRTHEEPQVGQRLIAALWRYFENSGQVNRALELVPQTGGGTSDEHTRARALIAIGYLHERIRDLAPSLAAFTEASELAQDLSDQVPHVRSLNGLGTVQFDYSNIELAQSYLQQANELAVRIGDERGQMTSAGMLGIMQIQLGEFENAISISRDILRMAEKRGDAISVSTIHINNAICYQNLGRFDLAETSLLKALASSEQADDITGMATTYANLAGNSMYLGETEEANDYAEKGLKLSREAGLKNTESVLLVNIASIKHNAKDFGASVKLVAEASRIMDFDGGAKEQIHFASIICETCIELGFHIGAAEMLGAVKAMRKRLQVVDVDARGRAEAEALDALDPESNPIHAQAMARGAAYDRSMLVQRIQELSEDIVAKQPPIGPMPEDAPPVPAYHLSPREIEVICMVAEGMTNAEIAEQMFVSIRTVTTHLTNIFNKLDVNNRTKAIAVAKQAQLV